MDFLEHDPNVKQANFAIAVPYPGTEFHTIAAEGQQGMELLSDDFVCISSKNETQTKDEMLEWVGNFEGRIDDFKTLYENDEVLVGTHSVSAYGDEQASIVMFFATLKGYGKISSWRIHRSFT